MELDDLKKSWQKQSGASPPIDEHLLMELIKENVTKRSRSIKKRFIIEIIISAILYAAAFLLFFLLKGTNTDTFLEIIGLSAMLVLPVIYRFIRSLRFLNEIDFSREVKNTLRFSLNYFKTTLSVYRWTTWIYSGIIIIFVVFNSAFSNIGILLKAGMVAYIILIMILTVPYLNWLYGKQVKELEESLKQLEEN